MRERMREERGLEESEEKRGRDTEGEHNGL